MRPFAADDCAEIARRLAEIEGKPGVVAAQVAPVAVSQPDDDDDAWAALMVGYAG